MSYYQLLRKIKKLKVKELHELDEKLVAIHKIQLKQWDPKFNNLIDGLINVIDIEEALTYCLYHFKGGMKESLGFEVCPCNCYCENCELIPEDPIGIRMQSLGKTIGEENVMIEFNEKYSTKEINE